MEDIGWGIVAIGLLLDVVNIVFGYLTVLEKQHRSGFGVVLLLGDLCGLFLSVEQYVVWTTRGVYDERMVARVPGDF